MLKTTIPFVDLRGKTPVDLLRAYPDRARALINAARRSYGALSYAASAALLPIADKASHRWLARTKNPYLHEAESFADILGMRGIYALNMSYEWGCTSGAYRAEETVSLLRVLDWPFAQLGKNALVVLQSGKAGEFYNVTWPGLSGVFNAMAPGRFSAALNLAPMRDHQRNFIGNWIKNRRIMHKENGIPPAHLLRQVCEQATDYAAAKETLMTTPLAVPAIFILAGVRQGEGCVIERLENAAHVRELVADQQVVATNHFHTPFADGTKPRPFFDSPGRYKQGCALTAHDFDTLEFTWLRAPMLNPLTRLAMVADAATGRLQVQGYEGTTAATSIFNLPTASHAA